MDIVERMQRDLDIGCSASIGDTKKAIAEIKRLREALRYEENRSNRIGTHGDGCYSWGPSHYECAMREIEKLKKEIELLHNIVANVRKDVRDGLYKYEMEKDPTGLKNIKWEKE